MFFEKVDLRSRKTMTDYLTGHFRYHTMSSWNRVTSYANNVKLHQLDIPNELYHDAYQMLDMEEFRDQVSNLIYNWESSFDFQWQVGQNGRMGGYLVMYRGSLRPTEHKSFCTQCGQQNFKTVEESSGKKCGRCGKDARVNYKTPPMKRITYPGQDVDMHESFEDWSMDELRDRVRLIQSFDRLCDQIVDELVYFLKNYTVEDETVMVPKTIKVLQPAV